MRDNLVDIEVELDNVNPDITKHILDVLSQINEYDPYEYGRMNLTLNVKTEESTRATKVRFIIKNNEFQIPFNDAQLLTLVADFIDYDEGVGFPVSGPDRISAQALIRVYILQFLEGIIVDYNTRKITQIMFELAETPLSSTDVIEAREVFHKEFSYVGFLKELQEGGL